MRRIGEVAKLFVESGTIILAAFVSTYREDREQVRSLLPHGDFYEVYCECDIEECENMTKRACMHGLEKEKLKILRASRHLMKLL